VVANVDGRLTLVGNAKLMAERGVDLAPIARESDRLSALARTVMFVAIEGAPGSESLSVAGVIGLADTPRPEASDALRSLRGLGLDLVMITGDNRATAESIALQVGAGGEIRRVIAGVLPDRKAEEVRALQAAGRVVAMVGDGINDAPALARATVGIVMGAAGSDAALETADIALMADDLTKLPFTIRLSRRALAIIRQNIAFALLIKAVFLALALAGVATLWMAVFADMGASLLVTLNGMRVLGYREK
jgi:Cd2+/Zn2+-exporting ATPase